ncbi:MAG: hypothetical protein KAH09_00030 [Desulfobacula sp.]|nr:hypothetical protein [Desulfobacula sp.]
MDFDSIITIILILLFFTFPTILKQLNRKKKTSTAPNKAKNLSLFGKLSDKIREFAQEIEKQAKEKKQGQGWEELADDGEMVKTYEDSFDPDAYEDDGYQNDEVLKPMPESSISVAVSDKPEKPVLKPEEQLPGLENMSADFCGQSQLSSSRLQQAIIWSEILSKPVALRQE